MTFKLLGLLTFISTQTFAGVQAGKITGTDNFGNPCWVEIIETKNETDPLLINHEIKLTSNYTANVYTLKHPLQQINYIFKPADEYYSGRTIKTEQKNLEEHTTIISMVTLTIDKNHNPKSFNYHDNDGGPKDFRRRFFQCTFSK